MTILVISLVTAVILALRWRAKLTDMEWIRDESTQRLWRQHVARELLAEGEGRITTKQWDMLVEAHGYEVASRILHTADSL